MPDERLTVTSSSSNPRKYRAAREEVIAAVRARYAESLASAGNLRRLVLRLRMQREIARKLDELAPPDALYLQSK